ncbi:MAG: hypothetical protein ABEI99_05035 [Halobaculum sp.]
MSLTESNDKTESTGRLRESLRSTAPQRLVERTETVLREVLSSRLQSDDSRESKLSDLEDRRDRYVPRYEALSTVVELFDDIVGDVRRFVDTYDEYTEKLDEGMLDREGPDTTLSGLTGLYEHRLTPRDLKAAIKAPSLKSAGVLRNPDDPERAVIRRMLRQIVNQRVSDPAYHGIHVPKIRSADRPAFDKAGVYVSLVGDPVDNSSRTDGGLTYTDFEAVTDGVQDLFNITDPANQYDEWYVNGDPWEVGVSVFIQGISFLDNLRSVVEHPEGYHSKYQRQQSNSQLTTTLARHAFGLDRREFVRRRRLVDVEAKPEVFVDHGEETIRSMLRGYHETVSITGESDGTEEHEE